MLGPTFFSGIDQLGAFRNVFQQFRTGQIVIDQDFRPLQEIFATQGNETGITRTSPHQIDFTGFHALCLFFHNETAS